MSRRFRLLALSALSACYAPPNHRAPNGADAPVGGLDSGPALGGTDSAHPVEDERDDTMDDEVEQIGGGGPHAGDGSVLALDDGPCGQPIDRLHAQAEGAAFFYEERPQGPRIFPLCLSLDAAALAALEEAPRDDVVATVQFAGRAWEVGLHLKGSPNGSMRPISEKASFKIDFHEWSSAARFYGVKRLTLNSMIQDPTMAAEHAAWRLYAAAGVPAARHGYIDLWLNGEPYGLMGVVETMDEQQLARLFPGRDDGNLYEGGYGADLISGRDDKFELKEEGGQPRPETCRP